MTDEQKPELAQEPVASAAPEAMSAPVASEVQPDVKKEYVSTEPRHPLQDVLDKAAERAKAKEAATSNEGKPGALDAKASATAFDYSKWDGNALTLPDNIKKIINDNQTAFHSKSQEAAEFKTQLETLQGQVNEYLQTLEYQKSQGNPLFTEEEFQAAQLDPNKFLELTSKVAQHIVEKEKQQLTPMISQIQFNQQVAENEKRVNDFASKNPDFWNLYEAGILEPLVSTHGLEKGFQMASGISKKIQQAEIQKSQARVQEKKASVSATPTQSTSIDTVYVNNPNDVLLTAARYAAEGKKVKVKYKPN
jgi:hypothetical protein